MAKKQEDNKKDNVVEFAQPAAKKVLDAARLREEYDAEIADADDESGEASDEIAEFIINQLVDKYGDTFNFAEVIEGISKAYLNMLLQLVEESDYDPEEFFDAFVKEGEKIADKYVSDNNYEVDPVIASGAMTIASTYLFSVINDEDEE